MPTVMLNEIEAGQAANGLLFWNYRIGKGNPSPSAEVLHRRTSKDDLL
jgi:hypothetical protein